MKAGPGIALSRPGNADTGLAGAVEKGREPAHLGDARKSVGVLVGRADGEPTTAEDGHTEKRLEHPERLRKPIADPVAADRQRSVEQEPPSDRAEQNGD